MSGLSYFGKFLAKGSKSILSAATGFKGLKGGLKLFVDTSYKLYRPVQNTIEEQRTKSGGHDSFETLKVKYALSEKKIKILVKKFENLKKIYLAMMFASLLSLFYSVINGSSSAVLMSFSLIILSVIKIYESLWRLHQLDNRVLVSFLDWLKQ